MTEKEAKAKERLIQRELDLRGEESIHSPKRANEHKRVIGEKRARRAAKAKTATVPAGK